MKLNLKTWSRTVLMFLWKNSSLSKRNMIIGLKQRGTNTSETGTHIISTWEILPQNLIVVIAITAVMAQVASMKKSEVSKVNLHARVKNQATTVALLQWCPSHRKRKKEMVSKRWKKISPKPKLPLWQHLESRWVFWMSLYLPNIQWTKRIRRKLRCEWVCELGMWLWSTCIAVLRVINLNISITL